MLYYHSDIVIVCILFCIRCRECMHMVERVLELQIHIICLQIAIKRSIAQVRYQTSASHVHVTQSSLKSQFMTRHITVTDRTPKYVSQFMTCHITVKYRTYICVMK